MTEQPPGSLLRLAGRYDAEVFELGRPHARICLAGAGPAAFDALLDGQHARLVAAGDGRPDARLEADEATWHAVAQDVRGGLDAFGRGRLRIRYDLHLGVGFLAATAGGGAGIRFRRIGRLALLAPSMAWLRPREPHGPNGFWTRLPGLRADSLLVWGRRDPLVPTRFARHVRQALAGAEHLELPSGHVPQLERLRETHDAILRFFARPHAARQRARAGAK